MSSSTENFSKLVEAVLFFEKDIVTVEKLMKHTGLDKEEVIQIVNALIEEYNREIHGMTIIEVAGGYSLQVKKEIYQEVKQIFKLREKSRLSQAALTVLSIIAYKQPITKTEVDEIRGVSSENLIRVLIEKNLVQILGRKDAFGKPLLYGTTNDFLKHFNLKSLKDLPKVNELKSDEFTLEEQEDG